MMKLSPERLAGLARTLVETLTASGLIEPVSERRALTARLERVITAEMTVEDRINAEAKELMRKYESEISRGQMDEHQLFLLIKKQLVKDKGVIL